MAKHNVMLITGTSRGIGQYLTQYYLNKGYIVQGCSRKTDEFKHPLYTHHQIDITNEEQVHEMINDIKKQHDHLDITINNAGIAAMNHSLLTPVKTAESIMSTNLVGTFIVCRESAKLMRKNKFGRIVNLSSVAVPLQIEGEAVYAASKSAVNTLTKIMAREFAELGITCNGIGPSPIKTDLIRSVPSHKIDELINRLSIKRLGNFNDVANVIDFYIKPESNYITGQLIYLGGVS